MTRRAVAAPRPAARVADRRADLATIHCLQKELGFSREDAEALKIAVTSTASSADMSSEQRSRYIGHLRKLREKAGKPGAPGKPASPAWTVEGDSTWKKARTLWSLLSLGGEVRDNSDRALMVYVKRQTKCEHWRFLDDAQVSTVIESLKKWCQRAGVVYDRV